MFRAIFWLIIIGVFIWFGATVKLGKRTLFGHVHAVWATPEAQDMKNGIEEKAGPVVNKVERGVKAGYREATRGDDAGDGSGSASGSGSSNGSGSGSAIPSPQAVTGTN